MYVGCVLIVPPLRCGDGVSEESARGPSSCLVLGELQEVSSLAPVPPSDFLMLPMEESESSNQGSANFLCELAGKYFRFGGLQGFVETTQPCRGISNRCHLSERAQPRSRNTSFIGAEI